MPEQLQLVGEGDRLPVEWSALNRQLYRMFHSTVLPTILRNFDRVSMAHGIEVRMPFMDWRLVTYTMELPDSSKAADGYSKMIARRAMANLAVDNLLAALGVGPNAGQPPTALNPDVLKRAAG